MTDIIDPQATTTSPQTPPPRNPMRDNYLMLAAKRTVFDPEGPVVAGMNAAAVESERQKKLAEVERKRKVKKYAEARAQFAEQQLAGNDPASEGTPNDSQPAEAPTAPEPPKDIYNKEQGGVFLDDMLDPNATDQEIRDYYTAMGSPQLAEYIINPSAQGVTEVTSPVEFVATGQFAAAKLAGKAGLKLFRLGALPEYGAVMAAEEIGEDNMFIGIGAEVLAGVLTGTAAEKLAEGSFTIAGKLGKAINKSIAEMSPADLEKALNAPRAGGEKTSYAPTSNVDFEEVILASDMLTGKRSQIPQVRRSGSSVPKATYKVGDDIDSATGDMIPGVVGRGSGKVPVQRPSDSPLALRPLRVQQRKVAVQRAKVRNAVEAGDLRDPVVRQVISQATELTRQTADDITPEDALTLEHVQQTVKSAAVAPDKSGSKAVEAVMESGGPMPARIHQAVTTMVSDSWYGLPTILPPSASIDSEIGKQIVNNQKRILLEEGAIPGAATDIKARNMVQKQTKDLYELMRKRLQASKGLQGEELETATIQAISRKIANGQMGSNFQYDLMRTLKEQFEVARDNGTPFNYFSKLNEIETRLIKDYQTGVADETKMALANVNVDSLGGRQKSFVKGGNEGEESAIFEDAWFPTPPGSVQFANGKYYFEDWDIADNIVLNPDSSSIMFKTDLTPMPKKKSTDARSTLFDFATIKSRKDAFFAIQGLLNSVMSMPKKRVGAFTIFAEADTWKVKKKIFSKKENKQVERLVLPENEVEQIARLYGWHPRELQPHTSDSGFQRFAEDILSGYENYESWETMNPGSIAAAWDEKNAIKALRAKANNLISKEGKPEQAKKLFAEAEARESALPNERLNYSSAWSNYRQQRMNFVMKRMGLDPAKTADTYKYYDMQDRLTYARYQILNEIKKLEGSPDEAALKKMYMALQDYLGGTDTLGTLSRINRGQARNMGRREAELFQAWGYKYDPAEAEIRIQKLAEEQGITFDEAAEVAARDMLGSREYGQSAEEAEAGIQEILDNNAKAIKDGQHPESDALTREEATELYYNQVGRANELADDEARAFMDDTQEARIRSKHVRAPGSSAEDMMASDAFSQIEDKFGSRIVDPKYVPSLANGDGRINLLKVNSLDDIQSVLAKFDLPVDPKYGVQGSIARVLLDDLDPMEMVGIQAYNGHSQDMVNRLTSVIADIQSQTEEAAEILTRNPSDVLSALAFDKLQTIEAIFASQLANGQPSSSMLNRLKKLDMTSASDREGIDKIGDIVEDNYNISGLTDGPKADIDLRESTAKAEMYMALTTPQQRGNFMRQSAAVDEHYNMSAHKAELQSLRQNVSRKLRILCAGA